jgi:hypothetical protein
MNFAPIKSCLRPKNNFANKSVRAPVEVRFAFQLADHSFNDSRAEAPVFRHLHCRAADLSPAKDEPPVRLVEPTQANPAIGHGQSPTIGPSAPMLEGSRCRVAEPTTAKIDCLK